MPEVWDSCLQALTCLRPGSYRDGVVRVTGAHGGGVVGSGVTETSRFFHPHSRSAYKWWCLCFLVSEGNSKKVSGTVPDSAGIKLEFTPWVLLLYN